MTQRKRRRYHRSKPVQTTVYIPATAKGARRLCTIAEACAYIHVSRVTLWRLINKKIIKAYRFSRRTMIDVDSLDAFNASLPEAQSC